MGIICAFCHFQEAKKCFYTEKTIKYCVFYKPGPKKNLYLEQLTRGLGNVSGTLVSCTSNPASISDVLALLMYLLVNYMSIVRLANLNVAFQPCVEFM